MGVVVVLVFSCKCGVTWQWQIPQGGGVNVGHCPHRRWWNRHKHSWTVSVPGVIVPPKPISNRIDQWQL